MATNTTQQTQQNARAVEQQQAEPAEREELVSIDINDPAVKALDVEQEIDPTADAWDRPVPPPDGLYRLKLSLGRDGFKNGFEMKDGKRVSYIQCNLDARIQNDPAWIDFPLMPKVNTKIGGGKETNQVATLLLKMGKPQPSKTTILNLCQELSKMLVKTPELGAQLEWRAWDQHKRGWIACGMKNFPALKGEGPGGYNHIVKDSKGGDVVAKATPVRWLSLAELKTEQEGGKGRKAAGASAPGADIIT